jgi:hypothetical protein
VNETAFEGKPCEQLLHAVIDFGFTEEIFAGVFDDHAEVFQLVVRALDFAFVDGELLRERGG